MRRDVHDTSSACRFSSLPVSPKVQKYKNSWIFFFFFWCMEMFNNQCLSLCQRVKKREALAAVFQWVNQKLRIQVQVCSISEAETFWATKAGCGKMEISRDREWQMKKKRQTKRIAEERMTNDGKNDSPDWIKWKTVTEISRAGALKSLLAAAADKVFFN